MSSLIKSIFTVFLATVFLMVTPYLKERVSSAGEVVVSYEGRPKNYDITLVTAESDLSKEQRTISFDTGGGPEMNSLVVNDGEILAFIEPPYREGYLFDSWYTTAERTIVFDFTEPITSDITIYANWFISNANANQSEEEVEAVPYSVIDDPRASPRGLDIEGEVSDSTNNNSLAIIIYSSAIAVFIIGSVWWFIRKKR